MRAIWDAKLTESLIAVRMRSSNSPHRVAASPPLTAGCSERARDSAATESGAGTTVWIGPGAGKASSRTVFIDSGLADTWETRGVIGPAPGRTVHRHGHGNGPRPLDPLGNPDPGRRLGGVVRGAAAACLQLLPVPGRAWPRSRGP